MPIRILRRSGSRNNLLGGKIKKLAQTDLGNKGQVLYSLLPIKGINSDSKRNLGFIRSVLINYINIVICI